MSDTGRYFVITKSGRRFCVEPISGHSEGFGNINPVTKKLEKITSKSLGSIDPEDSIITKENGFKNITTLPPGTSPNGVIELLCNEGIERIEGFEYED